MNAGQMLGLLAGAGALNALSGGKDGKRFNSIVDMFDGGGAGQSGDKFEGGGLLSMLGNLFAKPYEAQDRVEQIAARTAMRNTPTTSVRPQPRPADLNIPLDAFGGAGPNITGAAAERGMGLDPFGGAGPNITGAASERNVGLDAFGGYGPEYTAPSYANMPYGEMGRMGGVGPDMYNIGQGGEFGPSGFNPVAPEQVSYTGDASGLAQQNLNNQSAMRSNMSDFTEAQWNDLSRAERRDRGLPVTPIDKMFAGSDAFAPPPPPQSMVDQNMMIGVLERAGLDRASLEQLGYSNIENLYNQHLNALRSRRRGM